MLLINYDFYDIHALICAIRFNSDKACYIPSLEAIIGYLENTCKDNGIDSNTVRSLIKPYADEQDELLKWVFINNYYTANVWIVKNEKLYGVLSAVLKEITTVMKAKDTERLLLLTDAVHNIPCALVDEANPEKRIACEIYEYRKRYDTKFLNDELKTIRTKHA